MGGGGGSSNNGLLDTAIMVGAGIAAPELAPFLVEGSGGALGLTAATGIAGAATGAIGGALTGQNPLQTAAIGGAGGALSGAMAPTASGASADQFANDMEMTPAGKDYLQSRNLTPVSPTVQNPYSIPDAKTNLFGQSLSGGAPTNAQLATSGITGLLNTQGIGPKYGVPSNVGAVPDSPLAHYNPYSAKGVQYPTTFANGGMIPVRSVYPQNQVTANKFAIPSQTPVSVSPMGMAEGGIADLGSYSDGGRMLEGPGDGMSDDIPATIGGHQPARLADGEFVVPADVVSHLGNGSTDAGAKQLYSMMDKVRKARTGTKKQGKEINASKFLPIKGYADGGTTTSSPAATTPAATSSATTTSAASTDPQYYNKDLVNLYQNVLGRAPDQAGYDYWNKAMQGGTSLADVTKAFTGSQEYTGNQADQSTYKNYVDQQLNSYYKNLLNRNPDAPGFGYWENQALGGTPLSDIQKSIASSQEAQSSPAGQANYAKLTGPQMTNPALESGSGVMGNSFFFNPMSGRYETNAGATMIAPNAPASTTSTSSPDVNAYMGQGAKSATAQASTANDPSQLYNDPAFQSYIKQQYQNYQNQQGYQTQQGGATGGLAALIAKRK